MDPLSPERLPELRAKLSGSARQFAEFLGKYPGTIYRWEKGEADPDPVVITLLTVLRQELDRR